MTRTTTTPIRALLASALPLVLTGFGGMHDAFAAGSGAIVVAQATSATPAPAPAAETSSGPRFDIARFDVQGNTLLKAEVVAKAVEPYTGTGKDFGDVQRALEALQGAYQRAGYSTVQVLLPEQELERGVVAFRVIETRIGNVGVVGNSAFDSDNIRRSVPGLQPGQAPNSREISANVRAANENPAKQVTVVLKQSPKDNEVDADIRVQEDRIQRFSASFDNTGTANTGMYRLGFGYQHANLFNRDHVATFQYLTSPEKRADVNIFGAGYRIPLYGQNATLEFAAGYSDVTSGIVQAVPGFNLNVAGSGTVLAARYHKFLPRIGEYEHRVSAGIDYRSYNASAIPVAGGVNQVADVTVKPVTFTYSGTYRTAESEYSGYASVSQNIFPSGSDAGAEVFNNANGTVVPGGGSAGYRVYRYGLSYFRVLPADLQFRAAFHGQYTRDSLISGEQFGVGGADNVRGLLERQFADDRGYRFNFELFGPDLAPKYGWKGFRVRPIAFYDMATTSQTNPTALAGLPNAGGFSVSSLGVGLRMSAANMSLRVDFAQIIDGNQNADRGDNRLHFSFSYLF